MSNTSSHSAPSPLKAEHGNDQTLKLDQAWRILNLNQELIRSADQKIYLLIVMSTILVTYVSSNFEKIKHLGVIQTACLILFLIAGGSFFYFALVTVLARTRKEKYISTEMPVTHPHFIFFSDIAKRRSPEEYLSDFRKANMDEILNDVCYQIHQVSRIARVKYSSYRHAWLALLIEVCMFLLLEFSIVL